VAGGAAPKSSSLSTTSASASTAGPSTNGKGTIGCPAGGNASFTFTAQIKKGVAKGSISYSDPGAGYSVTGTVTGLSVAGQDATMTGTCGSGCTFTAKAHDGGEPPNDTFGITTSTYGAGPLPVNSGNIQVRSS
jgi:hypothetical protein